MTRPFLPQGDIQQLDIVSGPEAAYEHCDYYMPECDWELPASLSAGQTQFEYVDRTEEQLVYNEEEFVADNVTVREGQREGERKREGGTVIEREREKGEEGGRRGGGSAVRERKRVDRR